MHPSSKSLPRLLRGSQSNNYRCAFHRGWCCIHSASSWSTQGAFNYFKLPFLPLCKMAAVKWSTKSRAKDIKSWQAMETTLIRCFSIEGKRTVRTELLLSFLVTAMLASTKLEYLALPWKLGFQSLVGIIQVSAAALDHRTLRRKQMRLLPSWALQSTSLDSNQKTLFYMDGALVKSSVTNNATIVVIVFFQVVLPPAAWLWIFQMSRLL